MIHSLSASFHRLEAELPDSFYCFMIIQIRKFLAQKDHFGNLFRNYEVVLGQFMGICIYKFVHYLLVLRLEYILDRMLFGIVDENAPEHFVRIFGLENCSKFIFFENMNWNLTRIEV